MEAMWRSITERLIQEAIDEGKFDNLPGKGKPLDLEEDMSSPPHLRVANRILKNAGVLPDWLQVEADMDRERDNIAKMRARIEKEYTRRKDRALAPAGTAHGDPQKRKLDFAKWLARERAAYLQSLRRVNTDITRLLLMAPSVPRVHVPYRLADETAKFDEAFPPLPGVDAPPPPDPDHDGAVKETVRALYLARKSGCR